MNTFTVKNLRFGKNGKDTVYDADLFVNGTCIGIVFNNGYITRTSLLSMIDSRELDRQAKEKFPRSARPLHMFLETLITHEQDREDVEELTNEI